MKNLLYLGNKVAVHGLNKTTIETLGPLLEQEGYALTYASSKKNPFFRLLDMLWSVVKNRKVAFVLIDTYSTSAFWYAFWCSQLCRLLRVPYVPLLHGGNLPHRLTNNPILCRMLFANAQANVAPSPYLLSKFKASGYANVVFIPNVLEITNYPFKTRTQLQPKILWVRAFATIYNPRMAIDVFHQIKACYPEATLCMVGPDKDGSLLASQAYAKSLNLEVTFTGALAKSEWMALASEYDIFINTTHFDNTPVSVMEAMALGLPVVSTNVGGIPYLLTDQKDALLVDDGDVDQMVSCIAFLLENPSRGIVLAQNARVKAQELDWQIVKKQWMDLLS